MSVIKQERRAAMPQMNKRKFFKISVIKEGGATRIRLQTIEEYSVTDDRRILRYQ